MRREVAKRLHAGAARSHDSLGPDRLRLQGRDRTVDDLWGYCRTCYYADTCRAGCTWTGFSLFGKAGNNPLCHHRALEMQRQGLRERLVPVSPAPGVPFDHGIFEIVVEEVPS